MGRREEPATLQAGFETTAALSGVSGSWPFTAWARRAAFARRRSSL